MSRRLDGPFFNGLIAFLRFRGASDGHGCLTCDFCRSRASSQQTTWSTSFWNARRNVTVNPEVHIIVNFSDGLIQMLISLPCYQFSDFPAYPDSNRGVPKAGGDGGMKNP